MLDLSKIREAVRREGGVSRRLFLAYGASLASIPLLGRMARPAERRVTFASDPFKVGVASGDPTERGVALWTRLAPQPLDPGGGMPPEDVEVTWEVASDDGMRNVVASGSSAATSKLGHSVHVEVDTLEPDRWYWYRFRAGDAESRIGRTRTMPTADAMPPELRFAFASCQHYETGYYTAYEHMANDKLDMVFHLGDYIYEYGMEEGKERVRKHNSKEIESLDEYRARHALYKSDPLLQTMHARCPWMVAWDDHEFENNYADDISEVPGVDPADFLKRRANAYQAYYEMMPLRHTSLPSGPDMQLYRRVSFGRLADCLVLDTRQFRSAPPPPARDEVFDAEKTRRPSELSILGRRQMDWLQRSFTNAPAVWNVMAQQVMMAAVDFEKGKKRRVYHDGWPAYAAERERLLRFLQEAKVRNPVVLTGDFHSNVVSNMRVDDSKAELPVVATEFIGTSISSAGDGEDRRDDLDSLMAENPGLKFFNDQRGYTRCTVTPESWRTDFQIVEKVTTPGAPVKTRASFVIENGKGGAEPA
jgi:alkaline phosphatase D